MEYLGTESNSHFDALCVGLKSCDLAYTLNPRLVRGLDYYTRTVFEWVSDQLGAQGTVCAGGRYDGLVEQLGGRATPAIGFAMGLERLIALLDQQPQVPEIPSLDFYLVTVGEIAQKQGLIVAEKLRNAIPNLRFQVHCGGGSAKSQFKKANRSGARYALILGEEELEREVIGLKPLRENSPQRDLPLDTLAVSLQELL
jgi:histidyl-tRNA synthetase